MDPGLRSLLRRNIGSPFCCVRGLLQCFELQLRLEERDYTSLDLALCLKDGPAVIFEQLLEGSVLEQNIVLDSSIVENVPMHKSPITVCDILRVEEISELLAGRLGSGRADKTRQRECRIEVADCDPDLSRLCRQLPFSRANVGSAADQVLGHADREHRRNHRD